MRLWRRNIQLRVVATTLLMSLGVVLLLGFVVIGQVRNGLLDAKVKAAQSQAVGGFAVAKQMADGGERHRRPRTARAPATAARRTSATWMSDLVESLSSGGQGAFYVVTLSSDSGRDSGGAGRGPRASGDVDPDGSVPAEPAASGWTSSRDGSTSYTRIKHIGSDDESSRR